MYCSSNVTPSNNHAFERRNAHSISFNSYGHDSIKSIYQIHSKCTKHFETRCTRHWNHVHFCIFSVFLITISRQLTRNIMICIHTYVRTYTTEGCKIGRFFFKPFIFGKCMGLVKPFANWVYKFSYIKQ